MKFLKIKGHLLDVLGESARRNMRNELGLIITPEYQFLEKGITLAIVEDESKAGHLYAYDKIELLEGIEAFNNTIDTLYEEVYVLTNIASLQLDVQLSGQVEGYKKELPLTSQENLKLLFNSGMAGISKSQKPTHLIEQ